jgi:diadenosine tetraphosphatase ApaH/serine/threonine PP2A family protein phosphatase
MFYGVLYCSSFTPTLRVSEIANIVRRARIRNAELGIGGVLVFDGARFCHYIEGPPAAVRALLQHIEADVRHTDFELLHEGHFEGPRHFPGRPLSYGLALDEAYVDAVVKQRGPGCVTALMAVLPKLELEP